MLVNGSTITTYADPDPKNATVEEFTSPVAARAEAKKRGLAAFLATSAKANTPGRTTDTATVDTGEGGRASPAEEGEASGEGAAATGLASPPPDDATTERPTRHQRRNRHRGE